MQGGYPNFHSQGVAQSPQSFNHLQQQQQRPEHQTMGFHDPFSMGREDGGGGAAASILPQAVPVNHHQTHGQQLPSTQQSNINIAQPQNSSTPFFDPFAEAPQLAAASAVSRNTSSFGQNPTSSQQPVAEGINNTQYQSFPAGPPAANDILSGFPAAMSNNLPDGPGPVVLQPAVNAITARALYSYNATDSTELSFVEGELLIITSQDDSGWWQGHSQQNPASIGLLPSNYVKII